MSTFSRIRTVLLAAGIAVLEAGALFAQDPAPPPAAAPRGPIQVQRAAGSIEVDGALDDAGWQGAVQVEDFLETNPGENIPPPVKTVAYLTYDDRYFYVAFDLHDPDPKSIRSRLGERDTLSVGFDYVSVILDTRNSQQTGFMFIVNADNVQADANSDDATGEDPSLDLYWDSATRVTDHGWAVEMRIPYSSLRYDDADPQTWGIHLYRNYPRDFRHQILSTVLPRGSTCFICHARKLTGLAGLPSGNHLVLAPYASGRQSSFPSAGLGSSLESDGEDWDAGMDVKWTPSADTALDATINPDFSQVESDVAQISANERFALFYPERRPFFLEGLELFATPMTAVYTRSITAPRWGARATGERGRTSYTFLVTEDRGGGSVIIPGVETSAFAPQDFESTAVIGRARYNFGRSFASFLVTGREIDGGGHNRVLGPDLLWSPTPYDEVKGQFLYSQTQDPDRPDLFPGWTGGEMEDHALLLDWTHRTRIWDWNLNFQDLGEEFRADLGFVPQVGIRDAHFGGGRAFWTEGLIRKVRPFVSFRDVRDEEGDPVQNWNSGGIELGGAWNSFLTVHYLNGEVRVQGRLLPAETTTVHLEMNPPGFVEQFGFNVQLGDEPDVLGVRPGKGGFGEAHATVRATRHLELALNYSRRWSDLDESVDAGERLFTAEVARVKATYTFTSRAFLRVIAQNELFRSDPSLYSFPLPRRDELFSSSALFAYQLNWQTVLYVGYGDDRSYAFATDRLEPAGRELFFKISYAFQR